MHIAVLGGGPIGLEMAVAGVRFVLRREIEIVEDSLTWYFSRTGRRVTLVERGPQLCSNVLSWGHVELFSPMAINMSTLGREILRETGLEIPREDEYLSGKHYVQKYLKPLQNFLFKVCSLYVWLYFDVGI